MKIKIYFFLFILNFQYIYSNNLAIAAKGLASFEDRIDLITTGIVSINFNYPIGSDIYLNNGTITLANDLEFIENKFIQSNGTVNLNQYNVSTGKNSNTITSTVYWSGDFGGIEFNSKMVLSSQWTFSGNCIIKGNGNILDMTSTGSLIIERGSTLKLKDLEISGLSGKNINALDDSCELILDNVVFDLNEDVDFDKGSLHVYNCLNLNGTYTFYYDSIKTFSIHKNSACELSKDLTLALRTKNTAGGRSPIWFEDSTSTLKVDSSDIKLGPEGVHLTRGALSVYGKLNLDVNSTDTTNGLHFGDGTQEGELNLLLQPASNLILGAGDFVIDCYDPNFIKSFSVHSGLARSGGNNLYIKNNFQLKDLTMKIDPASTMQKEDAVDITFDNCNFEIMGTKFNTTSKRHGDGILFLRGNDYVYLEKGITSIDLVVSGNNNVLNGNGSMSGAIELLDATSTIDISLDGQILNHIHLNGGRCNLEKDTFFGQGVIFDTTGTIDLGSSKLSLGAHDVDCTGTLYFDSTQGQIDLNSMIILSGELTFSGNCTLNGNGNILYMKPTGQVNIERGSKLQLIDLRIKDLENQNIKCLDDSALLTIKNCKTLLNSDYVFQKGSLIVDYFFDVEGTSSFIYSSNQPLVLNKCSEFRFLKDVVFSYSPLSANKDLISFDCSTSKICLNDATLHVTSTGLNLTKGALKVFGNSYIKSDALSLSEGIVVGDGGDYDNNFNVEVMPSAMLDLTSGYLIYNNVDL